MLAKTNRLVKKEDFATVFARGNYVSLPQGIAIKFLRKDSDFCRLGFPVGKNFSKKAVVRNRARRVLRSASRQVLASLKPGYDIVILLRTDYKLTNSREMAEDLRILFSKAKLFI